jgi:hypothetical protein
MIADKPPIVRVEAGISNRPIPKKVKGCSISYGRITLAGKMVGVRAVAMIVCKNPNAPIELNY